MDALYLKFCNTKYNIKMQNINKIAILLAIIIVSLIFFKDTKNDLVYTPLKDTSVILAFGDSLTYGFGTSKDFSYPAVLESKIGLKVINAGVNGEVSEDGLTRLPKFLEQKPDLVILCHGGNDIIRKLSTKELKSNLLAMINLIHQSGAQVLLVGVPNFGLFGFDIHEVYDKVADETGVIFEDEVLTYIEQNRSYKSDYIHPNKKGYEMMADAIIVVLEKHNIFP